MFSSNGRIGPVSAFKAQSSSDSQQRYSYRVQGIYPPKILEPRETETFRQKQDPCIFGPNSGYKTLSARLISSNGGFKPGRNRGFCGNTTITRMALLGVIVAWSFASRLSLIQLFLPNNWEISAEGF